MKILFLSISILIFSHPTYSQINNQLSPVNYYSNGTGAVSSATGGAGVAVADLDDSALMNPASVPLYRQKEMSLSYSKDRFSGFIADNGKEAAFPAAIGYEQYSNNFFKNKIYHLILAYPVFQNLSAGIDLNLNETKLLNMDVTYRQTRVNLGLIWQPLKTFSFGLVHKNRALSDTDLADSIDHISITTLGMAYVYQSFAQIRFDIETVEKQPSDQFIYKLGLETYLNDWVITRFGYRNDNINAMNFTTAGLGFAGPQFGLHYAYQAEAKSLIDPIHIIDLTVPF